MLPLQALVPITEDVTVSYELHRFIIGQKGSGIRKMMEEYEVSLFTLLPPAGSCWSVRRPPHIAQLLEPIFRLKSQSTVIGSVVNGRNVFTCHMRMCLGLFFL